MFPDRNPSDGSMGCNAGLKSIWSGGVHVWLMVMVSIFCGSADLLNGQSISDLPEITRSFSGQFLVRHPDRLSWLYSRPEVVDNTNLLRLDPALLAVAAERYKSQVWKLLGLTAETPWQGRIYLVLRPAETPEDEVWITSRLEYNTWTYQLNLPDVVGCDRYERAMSAVILMEVANRGHRSTTGNTVIPTWLVNGIAALAMDADPDALLINMPTSLSGAPPVGVVNDREHGLDDMASAHAAFQKGAALNFRQLSWPADDQVNGDDGGLYRGSAELFVHDLLRLPHGSRQMGMFLNLLPDYLNWQLAFYKVYRGDFPKPAAIDKWWALQVIGFASRNTGTRWTLAASAARLDSLLRVPVQVWDHTNSMPRNLEIPLQQAIMEMNPAQRDAALEGQRQELELAQFELAQPFAILAAGYDQVLGDFLTKVQPTPSLINKKGTGVRTRQGAPATLKSLDALDRRRRMLLARLHLG